MSPIFRKFYELKKNYSSVVKENKKEFSEMNSRIEEMALSYSIKKHEKSDFRHLY